jgi:hypothetical protein
MGLRRYYSSQRPHCKRTHEVKPPSNDLLKSKTCGFRHLNSHFFPAVRKLFAAAEANDVGSFSISSGWRGMTPHCHRERYLAVRTKHNHIKKRINHRAFSLPSSTAALVPTSANPVSNEAPRGRQCSFSNYVTGLRCRSIARAMCRLVPLN